MTKIFIQLITSFFGSLGFSLLFGLQKRHLFLASLGGLLSWGVYLAFISVKSNEFLACLAASIFAMIYSEFMARVRKSPATVFIIPSIIPLVPGSSLYYAMSSAVHGNSEQAKFYGNETIIWVLAIAGGISFVTAVRELK